jgi:Uncharacterised nucleotidyltransferase
MTSREFQVLLSCVRSDPSVESIKSFVSKGIDWHSLLKSAGQHGVRPKLLRTLKSVCWNAVPEAIQFELVRFNRTNTQKNLIFTGELLRLLDLFEQNRMPIAVFKGPVLAESVYGDLSLREFSDLDMIVHEADLCKAEDILTARGYQADFPDREFRSAFLRYHGQYAFRNRQTGISVDLHWQLSSKGMAFPIRSAELWPKLSQVTIAGRTIPTLAHDDLALLLAAHGTKEGWRSLIWVCDFAELLRTCDDINWLGVLERAQRAHYCRSLLLANVLAYTLLDAPAPLELVNKARNNSAVQGLAKKVQLRMLRTTGEGDLAEFLDTLNTHDKLRHRLWLVVRLLTTRTVADYQSLPLSKPFWGIYYLTRPFRLGRKAAQLMLSRITAWMRSSLATNCTPSGPHHR